MGEVTIHHGDCLDVLRAMPEASVEAVVTDPPAGIAFMGREWDRDKGGRDHWIAWMAEVAAECRRVIKPGGHALVWALPRTSHWTATAWENAGWTVRDRLAHLFGVGFPKSLNVSAAIDRMAGVEREVVGTRDPRASFDGRKRASAAINRNWRVAEGRDDFRDLSKQAITAPATDAAKQWDGWGTSLKPAMEDWWLFRAPLSEPTVAANVLRHAVGGLNIDKCRVGVSKEVPASVGQARNRSGWGMRTPTETDSGFDPHAGRFPPNLLHDGSPEVLEAFGRFKTHSAGPAQPAQEKWATVLTERSVYSDCKLRAAGMRYGDLGGSPARFFPALGFTDDELRFYYSGKAGKADRAGSKHPTIKPVALMRWLCRLITPPGGTVLDPFAGSGTTGEAALLEGFSAILVEREAEYVADIKARLARMQTAKPAVAPSHPDLFADGAAA